MTEKLYYTDAYLDRFSARVISVNAEGDKYAVELDRTAFFPEEGGQSADGGKIDGIAVLDVREKDGHIYHLLPEPLAHECVECEVDFATRFEKMQCHTAEHILCGIIHRLYGYENVGFHLGDDLVTFDVGGELTAEEIAEVEYLANKAVFDNLEVTCAFPTPEELSSLTYRAKLDITEGVRIVSIGEVDSCACCAPHVARTGEIGMIKLLDFMRHRGGMRINMVAGYRALADYGARYLTSKQIGALTSTPSLEIYTSVERMHSELESLRRELEAAGVRIAISEADRLAPTDGNAVVFVDGVGMDALRELANAAVSKVGGILVVLTGTDGDYKYVAASASVNLRDLAKEINAALSGRGGGRPEMIQGSLGAPLEKIREYFR